MDAADRPRTGPGGPGTGSARPDKGLRPNALGVLDALALGVASTGPAYSMAATLGAIVVLVGTGAPAVVLVAFLPVFAAALGYHGLNRAEPDCGTSFVWISRAFGPGWGWMAGWAIIVADVLVMASLAQVAAQYGYLLLGADGVGSDPHHPAVTALGVVFVVVSTMVCVRGISLTARVQLVLVVVETAVLVVFSVVALVRVYFSEAGPTPGSGRVSWEWFDPTRLPHDGAAAALVLMVFLYWGWDSVLSVNEETRGPRVTPGRAAIYSTLVLVSVYLLFTTAALAYAGPGTTGLGLAAPEHADDVVAALAPSVFGSGIAGRLAVLALLLMVLTSAAASTQTTLLPTARTTFSMAWHGALPRVFGRVHPRHGTPTVSTWAMCVISVALYLLLDRVPGGQGVADAVTACGVAIGFYYGLTALAAAVLLRGRVRGRARVTRLLLPAAGGVVLLAAAAWTVLGERPFGGDEGGIRVPLPSGELYLSWVFVLGVGSMLLGLPLMWWWRRVAPAFFTTAAPARRLPADPDAVAAPLREG